MMIRKATELRPTAPPMFGGEPMRVSLDRVECAYLQERMATGDAQTRESAGNWRLVEDIDGRVYEVQVFDFYA